MGFRIYYRSTRPVTPEEAAAIREAAEQACRSRTWLSCEPVSFFEGEDEDAGHLLGGSKPNFSPHPDDVASAASEGLPDGDVRDLLDILCTLSRDHGVDWEITHDHEPGPVGHVRGGICDRALEQRFEALADVTELLAEFEREGGPDEDEDDDDEGPRTLRIWDHS
jgi:hypothetical protein